MNVEQLGNCLHVPETTFLIVFHEMHLGSVQSLGEEDPLVEEMATHSSTLAWEIPRTEEPGRLHPTGLQRVRHD